MNNMVIIIALLAGVVSLQYWRGRKLNLSIIRGVTGELEKVIEPLDTSYTWIGGYVGVVGKYKIKDKRFSIIETTVSLLPRHSLLYFPISLLIGRRDRVEFLLRSHRTLRHRVHIKPGKKAKKPKNISRLEELNCDTVEKDGQYLKRWYDDQEVAEQLTDIFQQMADPDMIKHLAINRAENAYYASVKITRGAPNRFVEMFMEDWEN